MKRVLALVLAAALLLGCVMTGYAAPSSDGYVDLKGGWHFKLYRKYSQMFQYLAYGACKVSWEDAAAAAVPNADTYSDWETVETPSPDYSTGGLLQMTRDGSTTDSRNQLLESDLFPKWSEAWMCKTVDLPAGFLREDTVTLLLGIIDDTDVVYVNGQPVAASGFKTASGSPSTAVPALGGFDQGGSFRFEKSYWEVSREYEIPARYFTEGENEIAIRVYNNNSFGGFYDRIMALCGTKSAVRVLKGLPTQELASSEQVAAAVSAQVAALQGKDIEAYAATLYDGYVDDGITKEKMVERWTQLFQDYDTITVTDTDPGYYRGTDNTSCYSANRTITGVNSSGSNVLVSNKEWLQSFVGQGGKAVERGNWSRCYTVTYPSALMNSSLQYSVYLPKSYYTKPDRSYPVVYLLHGINSTGKSFVDVDRIASRMDGWVDGGKVAEMIVVMPNSGKNSFYTDTPLPGNGVGSDNAGPWATHITTEIRGEIEDNYRTLNQPAFRALTGISMGGGGAFKLGSENPGLYSSVASHMGAVSSATIQQLDALSAEELAVYDFYLDCGNQDAMVQPANTQLVGEYLQQRGARVSWSLRDGGHNSAFYMAGMPLSMEMHSKHFIANGLYDLWGINTPDETTPPNEANAPKTLDTIHSAAAALQSGDTKLPKGVKASGDGHTALVPINLYSSQPDLLLDTLELLSTAKEVGLSVRLDGGKAQLVVMGGFTLTREPGRVSYPLYFAEQAPNHSRIMAGCKDGAVQTFKLGADMLFPTTVTVQVKTTLANGTTVYLNHFSEETGRFTPVSDATVANGHLTFSTQQLGEFVVTASPL